MIRPVILPMFFYDFNIWGENTANLMLIASEWMVDETGNLRTNHDNSHTITFRAPLEITEIEYLLDDLYVNQYPLTDYDTWEGLEFLTRGPIPAKIDQFLQSLPDYTIPNFRKELAYE